MSSNQPLSKTQLIWKRFFLLFLPMVIISLIVAFLLYRIELNSAWNTILSNKNQLILMCKRLAISQIRTSVADVNHLANYYKLEEMSTIQSQESTESLHSDFLDFYRKKKVYNEISYFDTDGKNLLKIVEYIKHVNLKVNSVETNDPSPNYADYIDSLGRNDVFYETLKLCSDKESTVPYERSIQFGKVVYNHKGEKTGIVLLNLDASMMMDNMQKVFKNSPWHYSLLNKNGRIIFSDHIEINSNQTLCADINEELWETIRSNKVGQFESDNDLFLYHSFDPFGNPSLSLTNLVHSRGNCDFDHSGEHCSWIILAHSDAKGANIVPAGHRAQYVAGVIIVWILHAVFSWFTARLTILKRYEQDKSQMLFAVRRTARTVAHEFRQPLGALRLIADIASVDKDKYEIAREHMKRVPKLVDRMDNLVKKLLNITEVKSKNYALDVDILDLDNSASKETLEEKKKQNK